MSRDLLDIVEVLAHEKNVGKEVVLHALESALASAVKKSEFPGEDADIVVRVDPVTGKQFVCRQWKVVPDDQGLQEPDREILQWEAKEDYSDQGEMNVGDYVRQELPVVSVTGRRFATDAKQVILQKLREAERSQILNDFLAQNQDKKIVSGQIKRMDRGDAIVEIGRLDARLLKSEMIPRQNLRPGDRVKAYVMKVDEMSRQQQVVLSRICPEFLIELVRTEVPEIDEGLLEVKGCERIPGVRAKIAVYAKDKRIDPIGACVGIKGSRIQAVTKELNGERIDIVLWSDQPAEYVIGALAPASIKSIVVHEDSHRMEVVAEDGGKAIGIDGDNVKLASRLTGWDIQVLTEQAADEKRRAEQTELVQDLVCHLDVDENVAELLIEYGIETIEEVAYVPEEELLSIEELDEETIKELRSRARTALLTVALEREEILKTIDPQILGLEGMDNDLATKLGKNGIKTLDDLADLATDELIDIAKIDEDKAMKLITIARAHWNK
ncbi:MAG: transcription termination/antitermination protein NusA [Burkholderiaceae bacterium]|nr:transcription termination/antitermination protein NusA [Burkholderiaceae bacterium]